MTPMSNTALTAFKSPFLRTLAERGFLHQCSNYESLDALALEGKVIAYVGYDCTAALAAHWQSHLADDACIGCRRRATRRSR